MEDDDGRRKTRTTQGLKSGEKVEVGTDQRKKGESRIEGYADSMVRKGIEKIGDDSDGWRMSLEVVETKNSQEGTQHLENFHGCSTWTRWNGLILHG